MGKVWKIIQIPVSVLGAVLLVISVSEVPAHLAMWSGWFKALVPHLKTAHARLILGLAGAAICLSPWAIEFRKLLRKRPNLSFTPHGDSDTHVYLEVTNHGASDDFSVQLKIIGCSRGGGFKKYSYIGQWRQFRSHVEDTPSSQSARIETGMSKLLKIANAAPEAGPKTSEMSLVGIGESVVWNKSPEESDLPFFVLSFTFFGKNHTVPMSRSYRVGPRTSFGPIAMEEVTA
jgi:hypothetical protein